MKDCIRPIRLDKGTASYPKAKEYQKMKVAGMELSSEEEDSSSSEDLSSECSDSEEESADEEESERDYFDQEEHEDLELEEGNWWDSPPESY